MTTRTAEPTGELVDTRTRLLAAALRLFSEHGVEGASLQMIADDLGITKAAVYYHFRTKDEIVDAVAEPLLRDLGLIAERAIAQKRRGAQIDHLLHGLVDLVVGNRTLAALYSSDPGFARAVEKTVQDADTFKARVIEVVAGPDPDIAAIVTAHVALAGIALAGGSPDLAGVSDEDLRDELLAVGRRVLGRPRPRAHL